MLVFGILGLVCCGPLSVAAWVMGHSARREMNGQLGVAWTNRSTIAAGWVLGIIGTVFWAGILLLFIIGVSSGS